MAWFSDYLAVAWAELGILSWHDLFEIIIFSWAAYTIIRWLSQDSSPRLLTSFYLLCGLFFVSWHLSITGLTIAFALALPVIAPLFVILHQKTLQQHFITLKSIKTAPEKPEVWLEELIQASLRALNINRHLICIIERYDSLASLLSLKLLLQAPINRPLLDILIKNESPEEPLTLLVHQTGKITALNPTLKMYEHEAWVSDEVKILERWKQDAILITEKSDAIVFVVSHETRLFDLVIEGKCIDHLSANATFSCITQYMNRKQLITQPSGAFYASHSNKDHGKQPRA